MYEWAVQKRTWMIQSSGIVASIASTAKHLIKPSGTPTLQKLTPKKRKKALNDAVNFLCNKNVNTDDVDEKGLNSDIESGD